ncbi:SHOCT domain-containing protein [Yoonia sp.]|uniref:SHOCT domain-containing protein n=1 Tax=Yoonia sp. TaxID=2212373 RepID=UPI003F6BC3F9
MEKIAATAALLVPLGQVASADTMGSGYGNHMYGDGYGFIGLGMMLLFWGLVVLLAVLAYKYAVQGAPGAKRTDALEILRQRLAKGEIDPEEFEARRKALGE